jgi:hypothetical protein
MPTTSSDQSHSFLYVDSDVPAGMTLSSWRSDRERTAAAGRGPRLLGRLGAR